jgi:hypothetical protein
MELTNRKLLIGLGTGRCGTVTLRNRLKDIGIEAFHESYPIPWEGNQGDIVVSLGALLKKSDAELICDVAYYWLPHVETLCKIWKNVRFLCLKRPMLHTVDSFRRTFIYNYWTALDSRFWKGSVEKTFFRNFPKYDLPRREALKAYWINYYMEAHRLEEKLDNFVVKDMYWLHNTQEGQKFLEEYVCM